MNSIGAILREARLANGLGMRKFAVQIGMKPSRLCEIERSGEATPKEWDLLVSALHEARKKRWAGVEDFIEVQEKHEHELTTVWSCLLGLLLFVILAVVFIGARIGHLEHTIEHGSTLEAPAPD